MTVKVKFGFIWWCRTQTAAGPSRNRYLCSVSQAVSHWTLLQPSLLRADAVAVRVPGRQHPTHTAPGSVHLHQNPAGVLLQLLHLLADVRVFCGCGWEADRQWVTATTGTRSARRQDTHPRRICLNTSQKLASAFGRWTPAEKEAPVCWPAPASQRYMQARARRGCDKNGKRNLYINHMLWLTFLFENRHLAILGGYFYHNYCFVYALVETIRNHC